VVINHSAIFEAYTGLHPFEALVVCAPLVHRVARLHVTSLFAFAM
jgi:hypothetical protein